MVIEQHIVLVNDRDEEIGNMGKMEVHRLGLLHRAFSVFVFNTRGEMLLQQRALKKYHSPGLWTNTCCSHPYPGENVERAALRRLSEEMGFSTALQPLFSFIYRAEFTNGLIEHEYDHVFVGSYEGPVVPDPEEVNDYCFKTLSEIEHSLLTHPDKYTPWFHIAFPRILHWVVQEKGLEKIPVAC